MVFHVGIDSLTGYIAVYNDTSKQTITIKTLNDSESQKSVMIVKSEIYRKINKIYEKIKAIANEDLGHACIFMDDDYYDDEIRRKFVKKGKQFGFKKVLIINSITKKCLDHLLNLKEKLKVGDIFWIFDDICCGIWEKTEKKAKLIEIFDYKYDSITTKYLLNMKEDSGVDRNPNLIILDLEYYVKLLKIIEKLFPDCKCINHLSNLEICDISLIKARIMANDPDLKSDIKMCDVDNYLYEKAEIWIGSPPYEKILYINKGQLVPLQMPLIKPIKTDVRLTEITCRVGNRWSTEKFEITSEMFKIGEVFFNLQIDENCIISLSDYPETIEHRLKLFYSKQIKNELFNIPKNISTNNPNIKAVGIDLGMTRCSVAVNRVNGIELVAIDDKERQLPSYISFKEKYPICGQLAINQLQFYANSIIFDTKRIIGRNFNEIQINQAWPFEVFQNDSNEPIIRIQKYNGKNVEKDPKEVTTILLKHIKQKVEEFQGKTLDEVVITVPANFTNNQKIATHIAAELAGWKTVHLLEEPIAASIAYFIDRPIPSNFNILIFDLGGGTLDLCIFKVENNKLKIIAVDGDCDLGGRNFDDLLFHYFAKILKDDFTITINERNTYRLLQKCVEIKHTLSVEGEASLDVSDFNPDVGKFLKITRQEFEEMSMPLQNNIQEILKKTFAKTNVFASDINKILLVGGGCRMPIIQLFLRKRFPNADHNCSENPDEMVAKGAAYYSSFLMSKNDGGGCNVI